MHITFSSIIHIIFTIKFCTTVQIVWDNTISLDTMNEQELGRDGIVRMPNQFLIFPGTKWCGAGNIADNDNDYGKHKDTDKCCQKHDFCPEIIEGHQSKYNLTNTSFYTRLSCECDQEFRKCLKSVNSPISNQVGYIYFTGLGTQCFKEDYSIVGCKTYSYVGWKKCVNYELDETKPKLYQWFDVPNY